MEGQRQKYVASSGGARGAGGGRSAPGTELKGHGQRLARRNLNLENVDMIFESNISF